MHEAAANKMVTDSEKRPIRVSCLSESVGFREAAEVLLSLPIWWTGRALEGKARGGEGPAGRERAKRGERERERAGEGAAESGWGVGGGAGGARESERQIEGGAAAAAVAAGGGGGAK